MSISIELVEKLKERANISYAEGKEALEKCNGDLVEAVIYLEKQDKIKPPPKEKQAPSTFWASVKRLFNTCNETRFLISKDGETVINLSLSIVILITIFAAPIVFIGLIAALFTRHHFRLERPDGKDLKINKTFDDISNAASKVTDQAAEIINKK